MCRILCFADSGALANTVQQIAQPHDLHILSASRLAADVRTLVQRFKPELVLLEINPTMDNAHLYFFLRSDQATRSIPIILVTPSELSSQQTAIFGSDAVVTRKQVASRLSHTLGRMPAQRQHVAA